MNIGIVTQPLLLNYGGILQNYALQQAIKRLGLLPITIDHSLKYSRTRWLLGRIKATILNDTSSKIDFPKYGRLGHRNFKSFINKHIVTTRPIRAQIDSSIIKRYKLDACIVGSDQVWRPCYNEANLSNMYLDFVPDNVLKISYAASFGTDEWEYTSEQTTKFKNLLRRFNAISVRENSAIGLCKKHFEVESTHVLDPTLLLCSDDYQFLCDNIPTRKNNYILSYILDSDVEKAKIAQSLASKYNCELISISAHEKVTENDSIENWLSLFRDAQYVVTDSFHGTVFSVLFNKDFLCFGNQARGNSRIESLLTSLNLNNHLLASYDFKSVSFSTTDWDDVDARLSELRTHSISFLISALK